MVKKTLKQKIKRVCWWTAGLTILYFLVGAWLVSDGTRFDPIKTYNLLKDTLTLTATFLAPVAAFVLFSDWRVEHREKQKEDMSENIIKNIKQAYNSSYMIKIIIDDESSYVDGLNIKIISDQFKEISQFISEARESLDVLKRRLSPETNSFISVSQKLLDDNFSMWLGNLVEMFKLQEKYNGVPPHEIHCEYDQYDEYCAVVAELVWSAIKELKISQKEILI